MTKKLLLPALVLICTALFATNSYAQTCSGFTGANVQYVGVGSSAQFNSFAFAAEALITAEATNNVVNFWASSSFPLLDNNVNVTDTAKLWVAWDNASDCTVYAYFSVDSTVGIKSWFNYEKESNAYATNFDTAASFGQPGTTVSACSGVVNAGQPACQTNGVAASTTLPSGILSFLTTQPHPTCSTSCSGSQRKVPLPYCGQNGTTATTTKWCFFNAGHADIRPEDTLYATTRALSAYNSTNGLSGLGYGQAGCGATPPNIGCAFYESFGQGGVFNTVNFKLTGTNPISGASLPGYVTLNIGAAPVVVIAADADTTAAGLGNGAPGPYTVTNINHKVLAGFEDGTFSCTGDITSNGYLTGAGNPVQVLQREALSGTYNTFEFTGVRTLSGSAATAVAESKASSITWFTDDDSGQELNNDPITNYGMTGCASTGSTAPTSACGDPKYQPGNVCGTGTTPSLRLRVIGTGEMVKAVAQTYSTQSVTDALGYAFWGYGNMAPTAGGCQTGIAGTISCGSYLAHYLTVDGIDPLFVTPGGANDTTPNPNGAYHLPQCYLKSGTPSCFAIPFTHIYDGSYPLWTVLRAITFSNVSGASGQTTPASVIAMIANAEKVAGDATKNLDDFVPFFTNINTTTNVGDLNLGVFRSHYKQTNNPVNGYSACAGTFTSIPLTPVAGGCTVDVGGDVGGSVFTVQSDVDFNTDFGSIVQGGGGMTTEIFGLHQ